MGSCYKPVYCARPDQYKIAVDSWIRIYCFNNRLTLQVCFIKHENQACPPPLSQPGKLRSGTKVDILGCLESNCARARVEAPGADVTILDGAVVVNFLKPNAAKIFDEYAMKIFLPYVQGQLQHANRADVVWDQYRKGSLKTQTREKRMSVEG